MLVSHGAIEAALRRFIARCREVNCTQFLVGVFLRESRRRKPECDSKRCDAGNGRSDQRFTHDSLLHHRRTRLTRRPSIGVYAHGLNARARPFPPICAALSGVVICQPSRPSWKTSTDGPDELRRELRTAFVARRPREPAAAFTFERSSSREFLIRARVVTQRTHSNVN